MKNQVQNKEEEIIKRIQTEAELQQITCNEQKHKLKKFLQLSKQLQKPKDEKKIKELLQILKETNKPLPVSVIRELKVLEIMNSPYSQPLMGMIKDIENQINRKIAEEKQQQQVVTRPQTIQRYHKREMSEVPRTQEQLMIDGSSRRLELAIEAYNKDNQIIVHNIAASSRSRSHSRESLVEPGNPIKHKGHHHHKSSAQQSVSNKIEDSKSEQSGISHKLSTPKRKFAHHTPFPVHISDAKRGAKQRSAGRNSSRR